MASGCARARASSAPPADGAKLAGARGDASGWRRFRRSDSPNYDLLCWFVDEVLPLIEQQLRLRDATDCRRV